MALEVEARQGLVSRVLREPPPRALLRLTPTEVACACARGTRVALCSAASTQEACATVVGLDAQGHAIVSVDNATSLRVFAAWSAGFFGKASRGALHGVRIAPRPATMLAAGAPRHPQGTRLLVLRDGALLDMSVKQCLGAAHGSGHLLEDALGVVRRLDLNELNHCAQRFESAAALAVARDDYCAAMATRGAWVEDAVTGRVLQIEEQLLNIEMAAGEGAVAADGADLAEMGDADLTWRRGAVLLPGDRVRHRGRRSTVGFHNDDGAAVTLGTAHGHLPTLPRFHCARNLHGRVCGGRDGAAPLCASCTRFGAETAPLLASGANPRLHHITFDGGGSPPERALLLAHEVEKAGAITGVHRAAWVGAAFQNGDVVVVEAGVVTHLASRKRVPLQHSYAPVPLSTLPSARSSTVDLAKENLARRDAARGSGGSVISAEPLPFVRGELSFEAGPHAPCDTPPYTLRTMLRPLTRWPPRAVLHPLTTRATRHHPPPTHVVGGHQEPGWRGRRGARGGRDHHAAAAGRHEPLRVLRSHGHAQLALVGQRLLVEERPAALRRGAVGDHAADGAQAG